MTFYRRDHGLGPKLADRVRRVVLIRVRRALPVVSPIYDDGASEQTIAARYTEYYGGLRAR